MYFPVANIVSFVSTVVFTHYYFLLFISTFKKCRREQETKTKSNIILKDLSHYAKHVTHLSA